MVVAVMLFLCDMMMPIERQKNVENELHLVVIMASMNWSCLVYNGIEAVAKKNGGKTQKLIKTEFKSITIINKTNTK